MTAMIATHRFERVVPRFMLLAGFDPMWITDDLVREAREHIEPGNYPDLMLAVTPDLDADPMLWSVEILEPVETS